jgi:UPF0271 protein
MRVDLNADVGEWAEAQILGQQPISAGSAAHDSPGLHESAPGHGQDERLIPILTSASVACGFHAGGPAVMRATVRIARAHGVAVGAHPGLADRASFGRGDLRVSAQEAEDLVAYQVGALAGIAAAEGVRLQHVKAHGALYNMAARDVGLAEAVARAVAAVDRSLILFGLPASEMIAAARRAGLRTACEVFADRAYRADGSLVPRASPGAVLTDPAIVVARAVAMVRDRAVTAVDGTRVPLDVDTMCVHGDTPGAADLAARIREALEGAGVRLVALALE